MEDVLLAAEHHVGDLRPAADVGQRRGQLLVGRAAVQLHPGQVLAGQTGRGAGAQVKVQGALVSQAAGLQHLQPAAHRLGGLVQLVLEGLVGGGGGAGASQQVVVADLAAEGRVQGALSVVTHPVAQLHDGREVLVVIQVVGGADPQVGRIGPVPLHGPAAVVPVDLADGCGRGDVGHGAV